MNGKNLLEAQILGNLAVKEGYRGSRVQRGKFEIMADILPVARMVQGKLR